MDYKDHLRKKYPNVPEHALFSVKLGVKNTANAITNDLLKWAKMNRVFANRISSEGRYRPGDEVTDVLGHRKQTAGTWLPGLNKGLPDVIMIIKGRFIGIEVKAGKDRQSPIQKKIQQEIEYSKGVYLIVNTFDDFLKQIDKYAVR